jgi:hypothetical protein
MKTPTLFCCRLFWLYPLLFGQLHYSDYTMLPVSATQREEEAREIKGKVPIVAVTGGGDRGMELKRTTEKNVGFFQHVSSTSKCILQRRRIAVDVLQTLLHK